VARSTRHETPDRNCTSLAHSRIDSIFLQCPSACIPDPLLPSTSPFSTTSKAHSPKKHPPSMPIKDLCRAPARDGVERPGRVLIHHTLLKGLQVGSVVATCSALATSVHKAYGAQALSEFLVHAAVVAAISRLHRNSCACADQFQVCQSHTCARWGTNLRSELSGSAGAGFS
jgi:hypothetical protein